MRRELLIHISFMVNCYSIVIHINLKQCTSYWDVALSFEYKLLDANLNFFIVSFLFNTTYYFGIVEKTFLSVGTTFYNFHVF